MALDDLADGSLTAARTGRLAAMQRRIEAMQQRSMWSVCDHSISSMAR
jgi:hypothetical protein